MFCFLALACPPVSAILRETTNAAVRNLTQAADHTLHNGFVY